MSVRPDANGYYSSVNRKQISSSSNTSMSGVSANNDIPGVSEQVRELLQGGIQLVLASFPNASIYNKEALNNLMHFYRAMHSMTLQATKIEQELKGVLIVNSTRKPDGLFREFGNGIGLQPPAAEEKADLRVAGGNAGGNGIEEESGEPGPAGPSGTNCFVLNFVRSETPDVVQGT